MYFSKFLKVKEFVSIEKNLFLITFSTKYALITLSISTDCPVLKVDAIKLIGCFISPIPLPLAS